MPKGIAQDPEAASKNKSLAHRGKKHSAETIEKISKSHIGSNNPMYGVSPWNKDKHGIYSEETKRKISDAKKEYFASLDKSERRKLLRPWIDAGRRGLSKKTSNTSIELRTQNILEENYSLEKDIDFVTHKRLQGYFPDIIIPQLCIDGIVIRNLIIECFGCYWHACSKCGFSNREDIVTRDRVRVRDFIQSGYHPIVIWEHMSNSQILRRINRSLSSYVSNTRW